MFKDFAKSLMSRNGTTVKDILYHILNAHIHIAINIMLVIHVRCIVYHTDCP